MSGWHVTVVGRVVHIRALLDGGWRLRLAGTGGALGAAEIRPSHPLPLPFVGTTIVMCGRAQYRREHGWYSIDPVTAWVDAANVTPAFALADSAVPAPGRRSAPGAAS
jgi:hypothetical protein